MKITVLPGDGIGIEITREAVRVLSEISDVFGLEVRFDEQLIGGAAIKAAGTPFPEATRESCLEADAVLLGAVGAPEFDNLLPEQRPEKGLLLLRKTLGGFANLRPAFAYPALIESSPLKTEIFQGTDMVIVRELLGSIYFGEPRGLSEDKSEAYNTMRYSTEEVARVAKVAFETARGRKKKVTSVDKSNVLETSQLWRKTVEEVAKSYPDVTLEHQLVDSCAMLLVTNPTRFDVILTENMFGDILSDEAAVLTGSLGMLASATVGGQIDLFEPIHGSAPDIAGQNKANPLGMIASAAMLLRHTAKHEQAATAIENAIRQVLEEGYRTADIARGDYKYLVSTTEMGELVTQRAVENANVVHAFHAV
jgi:3-isopropylmalate dehydrogenase